MLRLLALLLLLACCYASAASEVYVDGYTDANGYTFRSGYWFRGGVPYLRETEWWLETCPGYYYQSRYYTQRWRWRYSYTPAAVQTATLTYGPGWKDRVPLVIMERDKLAAAAQAQTLDELSFHATLKIMGIAPPATFPPGLDARGMFGAAAMGTYQLGPHGVSGQTIQGAFTQTHLSGDLYGDTNTALLIQAAAKAQEHGQQYLDQGMAGILKLIEASGASRERVAAMLAQGMTAKAIIEALRESPKFRFDQKTTEFKIIPDGKGGFRVDTGDSKPAPMPYVGGKGVSEEVAQRLVQDCVACHVGGGAKAGLNVEDFFKWDTKTKANIWLRLTAVENPEKLMPRDEKTGKGVFVGREKLELWRQHLGG